MNSINLFNNIKTQFQRQSWIPAAKIKRPFVKHANSIDSPAKIWQYSPWNTTKKVSVIIPTFDAYRNGYFKKLISQINRQRYKSFEIIVVRGDPRQGRAINIGAAIAKGKYLITLDDDTSLPDPKTFENLVATLERHPKIGIAGGNNVIPQDANPFIKRVMKEIPRRSWQPVKLITDSDLAEHPLMIIRKDVFFKVGGENEIIPRGLDPYLRFQFRNVGYRVVVIPGAVYSHLPPDTLVKLMKQFFRNGKQAAFCNRFYPQWVIETPEHHTKDFLPKRSILYRTGRYILNFVKKASKGHFLYLIVSSVYAFGFTFGYLVFKKNKA